MAETVTEQQELGSKVREIRRDEADLTMEELAKAADVSVSLISQIERGVAEPSLGSLRRIGAALGVPIARFFIGGGDGGVDSLDSFGRRLIVRADERKHFSTGESDIMWELLVPDLNRKLEVLFGEVAPGGMSPPPGRDPAQHAGEEVLILLDGVLTLQLEDDEFEGSAGDTISFDPSKPHRIVNRGREPVRLVIVMTPPSF